MEFSKKEIIKTSWFETKNNLSTLICVATLYLMIIVLLFQVFALMSPEFTDSMTSDSIAGILSAPFPSLQHLFFILASALFITGLNLGFLQICINIFKKTPFSIIELFNSFDALFPYVLTSILYGLIQCLAAAPGLMLLFIFMNLDLSGIFYSLGICLAFLPAVYLSIRLQFYVYFLLDKNKGCLESLKDSFIISHGYAYQLFIIGAILSIIVQLSIIPFFIGLILAVPFSKMATTYTYIKLQANN
jgi:uncharacterized membrane protein